MDKLLLSKRHHDSYRTRSIAPFNESAKTHSYNNFLLNMCTKRRVTHLRQFPSQHVRQLHTYDNLTRSYLRMQLTLAPATNLYQSLCQECFEEPIISFYEKMQLRQYAPQPAIYKMYGQRKTGAAIDKQ